MNAALPPIRCSHGRTILGLSESLPQPGGIGQRSVENRVTEPGRDRLAALVAGETPPDALRLPVAPTVSFPGHADVDDRSSGPLASEVDTRHLRSFY